MIKELVLKNRSFRTFDPSVTISREELLEFIDIARNTPSARNLQPLRYLPLERALSERILPYTNWAGALDIKLPPVGKDPSAFILLCVDKDETCEPSAALRDVGIVAQTILLAASEQGLGGCMIASFNEKKIKLELGLGESICVMLCIALGAPAETVVLEELEHGGSTRYYRDADGVHHVPKRRLEDIIIKLDE